MAKTPTGNKNINDQCDDTHPNYNVFNLFGRNNRTTVPKINEWEHLWCAWDVVSNMINHDTMLFEQPIGLRHPFIFYIGHIPAFLDVMITRHKVDSVINESSSLTEPVKFADIFERGIDPDMDDPKICNPHSFVPEDENGWPSVECILKYQRAVRNRLKRLLTFWEADDSPRPSRQIDGEVVWMCFEHEAMHLETLLYMIVQSPNFKNPTVSLPLWYTHNDQYIGQTNLSHLDRANLISFYGGNVEIGLDETVHDQSKLIFGWDNEHPKRVVFVLPFELQSRPVTNGEYWLFWKDSNYDKVYFPAAWHFVGDDDENNGLPKVKTSFGLCEFHLAVNWPVQVSCQQAEAYASNKDMRLPTEPEWIHFRRTIEAQLTTSEHNQNFANWNYGFKSWTPQPLNNERVHLLGDVWEWTSSVWNSYEGFTASQLYPGYSSDFFDGKHRVVLGASWATHPRIAERISFRNWYQWRYPYVFCGFRLCRSL